MSSTARQDGTGKEVLSSSSWKRPRLGYQTEEHQVLHTNGTFAMQHALACGLSRKGSLVWNAGAFLADSDRHGAVPTQERSKVAYHRVNEASWTGTLWRRAIDVVALCWIARRIRAPTLQLVATGTRGRLVLC